MWSSCRDEARDTVRRAAALPRPPAPSALRPLRRRRSNCRSCPGPWPPPRGRLAPRRRRAPAAWRCGRVSCLPPPGRPSSGQPWRGRRTRCSRRLPPPALLSAGAGRAGSIDPYVLPCELPCLRVRSKVSTRAISGEDSVAAGAVARPGEGWSAFSRSRPYGRGTAARATTGGRCRPVRRGRDRGPRRGDARRPDRSTPRSRGAANPR